MMEEEKYGNPVPVLTGAMATFPLSDKNFTFMVEDENADTDTHLCGHDDE